MVLGFLFSILTNAIGLYTPKVMEKAIDLLEAKATDEMISEQVYLLILIALVSGIFKFAMRQTTIVVSRKIEFEFLNNYLKHLQTLPVSFFHKNKTGNLMALATNDLSAVRNLLGPGIMYSTNTLTTFFVALYFMFGISWKLTLLAMIPFPLMSLVTALLIKKSHEKTEEKQAQFSKINSKAQENISGIRVIKAYVQEASEIQQFDDLSFGYLKKNMSLTVISGVMNTALSFLTGLGFCLILFFGGKGVLSGEITLGSFVAFNTYLLMLVWPMIALGWVTSIFQQSYTSLGRIRKVLETTVKEQKVTSEIDVSNLGEIEFRNVCFSYDENKTVLKNINLKIPAGSSLGIVGKIGSGKSTFVNLIPRLYEVENGEILLDGKNLNSYSLNDLREIIGYVPQETFLFSESIEENISFGTPDANTEKILEAAEIAQLKTNIEEFPKKFQTLLGERGITLSGGQKQRTAIARAIIKNPKILILDDSLSAVDTHTEDEILKGLKKIMKSRTTLIVAHRISTVQNCDKIIVFKDGKITEEGSHEKLLEIGGTYAEFYQKQLLQEEIIGTE
ncbi:ABC transporter ATP-binding protein [bacterium]|nr:ABC transporter ATP-binding protein [bacterium]